MISRKSPGSRRAESAVEPTRSQNMTVSWRRSAAPSAREVGAAVAGMVVVSGFTAESACPHSEQYLAPVRFTALHNGQRAERSAPQALQNLLPSGTSAWQPGHSTGIA